MIASLFDTRVRYLVLPIFNLPGWCCQLYKDDWKGIDQVQYLPKCVFILHHFIFTYCYVNFVVYVAFLVCHMCLFSAYYENYVPLIHLKLLISTETQAVMWYKFHDYLRYFQCIYLQTFWTCQGDFFVFNFTVDKLNISAIYDSTKMKRYGSENMTYMYCWASNS